MTAWITRLAAACWLACAFGAHAQPGAVVVGSVVSQTGPHAEMASGYRRGLELWAEEVNASGGLLGRKVELRLLDDGSEALRTGQLYVKLIREEKADLLIGPYGTAATLIGAAEAESARRVMVTGAAPSRAVHKRSPRYIFQAGVPYASYGDGLLALARERGYRNLYIIARDDPVAAEMAQGLRDKALKAGLTVADVEAYAAGASDFALQVGKAKALQADAWIAFGEPRDAGEMIKSLKKADYAPRLFFCRGASDRSLLKRVGQDAEFALGAKEYDTRLATTGNSRFVDAFRKKFGAPPGAAAAEGYAAATVLAEGVRRAGALDQEKVRVVLASLAMDTILGAYKVDPLTGEQLAAAPALTQVLYGREQIVWPRPLATAEPVLPYPQWRERKILK
ncbi:MAG: amino acid ABC transporter substrate-binding protein [Clostridia bacterium]